MANFVRCPIQNQCNDEATTHVVSDCQFGAEWLSAVAEDIFVQLSERWSHHRDFMDFHMMEGVKQCQSYQKTVLPKTPRKRKQPAKGSAWNGNTPQFRYNFRCRNKKSHQMPGNQPQGQQLTTQALKAPSTHPEQNETETWDDTASSSSEVRSADPELRIPVVQEQETGDCVVQLHSSPLHADDPIVALSPFQNPSATTLLTCSTPVTSEQKGTLEDTLQSPPSHTKGPSLAASPSLKAPNLFVTPPFYKVAPAVSQQKSTVELASVWDCTPGKQQQKQETRLSSQTVGTLTEQMGNLFTSPAVSQALKAPSALSVSPALKAPSTHPEQNETEIWDDTASSSSEVRSADPELKIPVVQEQEAGDCVVQLHSSPSHADDPIVALSPFQNPSATTLLTCSTPVTSEQKGTLEDTLQSPPSHTKGPSLAASPSLKAPNLFVTPPFYKVAPAVSQQKSTVELASVWDCTPGKHISNLMTNVKTFLQRNTHANDQRKLKESMERRKRKASERQRDFHAKKVRENEEKKKKRDEKSRLAKERRAALLKAKEAKARQLLADKEKKFADSSKMVREEIGKRLGPSKAAAHLDMVRQETEKNRPKLKELFANLKSETAVTKVLTPPHVDKDRRLTCTLTGPVNGQNVPATPSVSLAKAAEMVSYDMTPVQLDDSDEDIDEHDPKRRIPAWARSSSVSLAVSHQSQYGPSAEDIFSTSGLGSCDLATVFDCTRPRYHKRTSSAVWNHFPISPTVQKH